MPLAKHEAAKDKSKEVFYPLLLLRPDKGWVGWRVIDLKTGKSLNVFRRPCSMVLRAAAALDHVHRALVVISAGARDYQADVVDAFLV